MSTIIENEIVGTETDSYDELERRIKTKQARFGVIGLGYVGLPLALTLNEAGFDVTGIDIDTNRVDAIVAGRSYITDINDKELQQAIAKAISGDDRLVADPQSGCGKHLRPDTAAQD